MVHNPASSSFTLSTLTVSDKLLWYLTQYISDETEVTTVGTNLNVPYQTIRSILTDHQREIR